MMKKVVYFFIKIMRRLMLLAFSVSVLFGIFCIVQIKKAPDTNNISLAPDGYLTTITDEDENVVDYLHTAESNRIYVPLDEISINLQNAFIAIEDVRFYRHHGIDIRGILRALVKGVCTGNFSQGASTITQQLIKNNVLTSWVSEKSFYEKVCRKIQEQYLAIKIENSHKKEEILELYLNTINLGAGTRGVQVASLYYFHKNASDLSIAESALIAGITKNPSAYNPKKHPEKSMERQRIVLNVMLRYGYIDLSEYKNAIEEDVLDRIKSEPVSENQEIFSWFEDILIGEVISDLQSTYGYDLEDAWDILYSGGLTIHSTLDVNVQEKCEEVAMNSSYFSNDEEISIVVMEPMSGAVRAIVGGRGEKKESLSYNRAVESIRQPGATISVLGQYTAAIETGKVTLGTVFDDAPYSYQDGTEIHNPYYGYFGRISIHKAVSTSSNIVALKIFQNVGIETTYSYLQLFGFDHLNEYDKYESLALGGTHNGVTNLELTSAYNAIANGGVYNEAHFYTEVTDIQGNIILENTSVGERVIKESTSELLTVAMEDCLKNEPENCASFDGISIAGKSGCTNQCRDGWFIGYSPYYACGIWGGFDDFSAQESTDYVKDLWVEVMKSIHRNKNPETFPTEQLSKVVICSKCGKLERKGVCDKIAQENSVCTEFYERDTIPTDYCDCHIVIEICDDSQLQKGIYCPDSRSHSEVFLISGTEGTDDYQYVYSGSFCDIHNKEANKPETQEDTSNREKTIIDKIKEWYHEFLH